MNGDWKSAGESPQIPEGTKLAVRMRGSRFGVSLVEEIDGYYLNEYGLHYLDGCECFDADEDPEKYEAHADNGCPHSGYYHIEPSEDFEEGIYQDFRCVEWCKR